MKNFKSNRSRRIRRRRVLSILSCIVVFATTYALILPAITLDQDSVSGEPGVRLAESFYEEPVAGGYEDIYEEAAFEEAAYEETAYGEAAFEEAAYGETAFADAWEEPETVDFDEDASHGYGGDDADAGVDDGGAAAGADEGSGAGEAADDGGGAGADGPFVVDDSEAADGGEGADDEQPGDTASEQQADISDADPVDAESLPEEVADEPDMPELFFRAELQDGGLIVEVSAPAGAFPAGTSMSVMPVYEQSLLDAVADAVDGVVKTVVAADITFFDAESNKIEPACPIRVTMTSAEIADAEQTTVVHVDDDGGTEIIAPTPDEAVEESLAENQVVFEAEAFSVYALVETVLYTEVTLPGGNDTYTVTVTAPAEARIPEGSTLRVVSFEEGSEPYEYARNSVLADKKEKNEPVDIDCFNLAALDISIIDPEGNEIEPAAAVQVDIRIKELPGVEDLSEIRDTLEIQHHVEVAEGVVVEKVFDGSEEASFQMETDDKVAGEGTAVDPYSVSDEDFRNRDFDEGGFEASFDTEVFSTFTITWGNGGEATVHYGYMSNGSFVEIEAEPTYTQTSSNSFEYLIRDFEGYQYAGSTYYRTTASATPAAGGTRIQAMLRYRGGWRYHSYSVSYSGSNWMPVGAGSHIYVVYEAKPGIQDGGTPKAKPVNPDDEPDLPSILKESESNDDGTANLSLSIRGSTVDMEAEKLADVIVVFDRSGSMSDDMDGNSNVPSSQQRITIAKNAVKSLAASLSDKKDSTGNPLIRMSLISFSTTADEVIGLTDLTTEGLSRYRAAVDGLSAGGGTNWEQALELANRVSVDPDRATFIIFVSDGNPTFRVSRMDANDSELDIYNKNGNSDYYLSDNVFGTGNSDSGNRNFNAAVNAARNITDHRKNFYTIAISNSVDRMEALNVQAGGHGNYTATSSSELVQAFDDIAASITAIMGFGDINMTDGITSMTQTIEKSGLTGVSGNFTYYKAPAPANWNDMTAEEKADYKPDDGAFSEWDPASEICEEAVYDEDSGSVKWNMGDKFVPEDGATYKVTFKVWPSQEAYDTLAKCMNDPGYYDTLTEGQKNQITRSGESPNYSYALRTNEEGANTTYKSATKAGDTVTTTGDDQTLGFNEVGPLGLASDSVSIRKEWANDLDGIAVTGSIPFKITADGEDFGSVELAPSAWTKENYFISTGLMTSEGVIYEAGHDYRIAEPDELSEEWEFSSDVYHPMVINNRTVMLIRVDSVSESEYTIAGKYYRRSEAGAVLTAKNERHSSLELSKTVVDESGVPVVTDEKFTFSVNVAESQGNDVYFTVYDTASGETVKDASVVNGTAAQEIEDGLPTGNFYAASGTELRLTLESGWQCRFINLHTGTSYSIEEETPPEGYEFRDVAVDATNGGTGPAVSERRVSGTVDRSNVIYSAAYTNLTRHTELRIRKVGEDGTTRLEGAVLQIKRGPTAVDGSPFTTTGEDIELRLLNGIYEIRELQAPSGYVILDGPYYFKAAGGTVTLTDADGEAKEYDDLTVEMESSGVVLRLKNHPGKELPMTGGSGTLPYTLGGLMLVILSALLYGFRMGRGERRLNESL